jgi:hypothetical protein
MRALALALTVVTAAGLAPARAEGQANDDHAQRAARSRSGGRSHAAPGRPGRAAVRPGAPYAAAPRVVPAPPRYAPRYAPSPIPYRSPRYLYDPFFYGFAPAWWGWGWGYGYYPLYPRPQYGYAPQDVARVTTRLAVQGGGTLEHGGSAAGLNLGIEGERLGFHLGLDGFYPGRRGGTAFLGGSAFDSATTYGLVSAHLTAALVTTDVARLRAELGGSVLSFPDASADAGLVSFGPDVGLSAQLGLLGPLALEGYFRVTPFPIPVLDGQAALALRFGPVALTAGWRELAVRRTDENAGFSWAGPQLGLGFRF